MTGAIRSAPWFKLRRNNADTKFERRTSMAHQQIPKSAAASIYPHLKSGTPEPVQRPQPASLAAAMFPSLVPQPPKPLTQSELKAQWVDRLMSMSGVRRR
jgi:hypothetical protein